LLILWYLNLNYVLALSVFIMYCVFQEVQGRPLRLNLVVDSKNPSSPPAINQNKGNNVNSLEMLFGISKWGIYVIFTPDPEYASIFVQSGLSCHIFLSITNPIGIHELQDQCQFFCFVTVVRDRNQNPL
jgi:hypothetical protein